MYNEDIGELNASIILAPDIKLKQALGMILVNQMGVADSLGSLGPPELAIHFNWPNRIRVNGAYCGYTFYQASTKFEEEIPEWLVLGINIPFLWSKSIESGYVPELLITGRKINDEMHLYLARKIKSLNDGSLADLKIGVLGLAFKANTSDIRNTKIVDLVKNLKKFISFVDIYDPWASKVEVKKLYNIQLIPKIRKNLQRTYSKH